MPGSLEYSKQLVAGGRAAGDVRKGGEHRGRREVLRVEAVEGVAAFIEAKGAGVPVGILPVDASVGDETAVDRA